MKKLLTIIFFVFPFLCHAVSDQKVFLNEHLKPLTTYSTVSQIESKFHVQFHGTRELLDMLKQNGTENPTVVEKSELIEFQFRTGEISKDETFPLIFEVLDTNDESLQDLVILGKSSGGAISLDSIISDNFSDEEKEKILSYIMTFLEVLELPKKSIGIGESFTERTPISLPVNEYYALNMMRNSTYKLLSVENNIAYLDVIQSLTMNSEVETMTLNGKGTGKGKIMYDIKNECIINSEFEIVLEADIKIENMLVKFTINKNESQTVKITKNDFFELPATSRKTVQEVNIKDKKRHIGTWSGIKYNTQLILVFHKNNKLSMGFGTDEIEMVDKRSKKEKVKLEYKIDYSKSPIQITLTMKGQNEQNEFKGIMRFISDDEIEIQLSRTEYPTRFNSKSGQNFILKKGNLPSGKVIILK